MLSQLLSNRVEKTPATEVSADRYQFLALSEAEPDLGVPAAFGYLLTSTTSGTRSWVDPTTNLAAPGSDTQVIFNNSGVLAGASGLVYNIATGRVGIGNSPTELLDVAGNITLRNSTTPTSLTVHNTYNDASNYELAVIKWDSNVLEIGTESAGSGTQRTVRIKSGGSTEITGGDVSIPNGGLTLGASSFFFSWNGRSRIGSSSNGLICISNSNGTDFDRLQLGGTTSSFPALKRNTASLEIKLADDSSFTGLKAKELNTENTNQTSEAATLATTTKTQIASFPAASFRSGKLIVQAFDSVTGEVQITELLVAHDGIAASATEYGVVYTGESPLVVYDVDVDSGTVRLLATRNTSNSTQYKISETLILA